jgi:hypothetical protein
MFKHALSELLQALGVFGVNKKCAREKCIVISYGHHLFGLPHHPHTRQFHPLSTSANCAAVRQAV